MAGESILTTLALTLTGGLACQVFARKINLPAIVPLLVLGVILGPYALAWVDPESLGEGLKVLVGFAVAVILFEGGLSLKKEAFRTAGKSIRRMVTVGALLTWMLCAYLAHLLFPDLRADLCTLFGALVIVTGPTVILPLLNTIRVRKRVGDVLRGEAILIDPIGALFAVLTLEYVLEAGQDGGVGSVLLAFGQRVGIGVGLGVAGAFLLDRILRRQDLQAPDMQNRTVLVGAIALYALSEAISHESGVLTVTMAGFLLGALHPPGIDDVEEFKGHIVALLVSMVFILLAANLSLDDVQALGWRGVMLVLGIIFIARPITVFLSTIGTDLSLREKLFLSWIAPRGIVAAAVSSLFALTLADYAVREDLPRLAIEGRIVMAMTFAVIVGTVLLQGLSARRVASWLGMLDDCCTGFLILGGNRVGIALGRALHNAGIQVLMVDMNYGGVRRAREAGVPARRTDLLDDAAMANLDLSGIGHLIALTSNDRVNRLACRLYRPVFGPRNTAAILTEDSPRRDQKPDLAPWLFGERVTLGDLESQINAGATIEVANIDEAQSVSDVERGLPGAIPLLALDANSGARFLEAETELEVGETLFYLIASDGGEIAQATAEHRGGVPT